MKVYSQLHLFARLKMAEIRSKWRIEFVPLFPCANLRMAKTNFPHLGSDSENFARFIQPRLEDCGNENTKRQC